MHSAAGLQFVLELVAVEELLTLDLCHLGVDRFFTQMVDERGCFAGSHEDIDKGVGVEQLLAGFDANHAAHQCHFAVRLGLFPGLEAAQFTNRLIFGGLAHHAGVEHDQIGIIHLFGWAVADLFQFGGDVVAVGDVHLAADGPDVIFVVRLWRVGAQRGGEFVGDLF